MKNWWIYLLLVWTAVIGGCSHTQRSVSHEDFKALQTGKTIGIEYVFDLQQYNYAKDVMDEIIACNCFSKVGLTHDVSDNEYDYIIRGNFVFYTLSTHNDLYYASTYLFLLPVVIGLPGSHIDGGMQVGFELYHKGSLLKTYEYEDIFSEEHTIYHAFPGASPEKELRLLTRVFIADLLKDEFGLRRSI